MGIREIPKDLWELNFLALAQTTSLSWMPLRAQGKENEEKKSRQWEVERKDGKKKVKDGRRQGLGAETCGWIKEGGGV